MKDKFKLEIGGKSAKFVDAIPGILAGSLIKNDAVRMFCAVSNSVDLLVQKVQNSDCLFWKIDMEVPVGATVCLKFAAIKKCLFFNIGEGVRVQFQPGEIFCFERFDYKTVQLPKSQILLFAGASKIKHEMILLAVDNVDQFKAENAMLNVLFNIGA